MKYFIKYFFACSIFISFNFNLFAQATIDSIRTDSVTCNGGTDGKIHVYFSGGISPFTVSYVKLDPPIFSGNVSGLNAHTYTFDVSGGYLIPASGFYRVIIKDAANQQVFQDLITVEEPTALTTNLNVSPTLICEGADITLHGNPNGGNGGNTFLWTGTAVVSFVNGTTDTDSLVVFNNSTAGDYSITYTVTDWKGCNTSESTTLTVEAIPDVNLTSSDADNEICQGDAVIFTADGTYTNYEFFINGGSVQNGASNTYNTSALNNGDVVSVTATNLSGCTNTSNSSITMTVNALPSVTLTSSDADNIICTGTSVTFTATAGLSNYNFRVNGSTAQNGGTRTYTTTALSNGDAVDVIVTNSNGCINTSSSFTFTVNSKPTIIAIANPYIICNGSSSTLSASGAGVGGSYTWTGLGAGASHIVSPSSTTTYTAFGTDANGCTNSDTAKVTVNALPTITATASPSSICAGDSTVLTGGGAGAGGTYSWDNGLGAGAVQTPSPALTTTYTVTGTASTGCSNTKSVTVTVNGLPTITISSSDADNNLCIGQSVTLTGNGGVSYAWNSGDNTVAITKSPTADTTYSVTGTDVNGCQNTTSQLITVYTKPTIIAVATPYTICNGSSSSVSASGAGVGGTYTWDNGLPAGSSNSVSPSSTTTYTATGTDAQGCSNTDTVKVTVNPMPNITYTNTTNSPICFGDDATVTLSGSESGYSYVIKNMSDIAVSSVVTGTGASIILTISNVNIPIVGANSYYIEVSTPAGCTGQLTNTVSVTKRADVTETVTSSNATCFGSSTGTLRAVGANGTAPYKVAIDGTNGNFIYNNNAVISVDAGSYQVVVRDNNGCKSSVQNVTITEPDQITYTLDTASASCDNSDAHITFSNAQGGNGVYQYSINGDNPADYSAQTDYQNLPSGNYALVVKDGNGCLSNIDSITLMDGGQVLVGYSFQAVPVCYGGLVTVTLNAFATVGAQTFQFAVSTNPLLPGTYQVSPDFSVVAGTTYYGFAKQTTSGCEGSTSIGAPSAMTKINININSIDSASCFNVSDGSIKLDISTGGGGSYTYDIDLPFNLTNNRTYNGLASGIHTIRVKDVNNCTQDSVVTVGAPPAIILDNVITTDLTCPNDMTGRIQITASGGVGALTYSLNSGAFTGTTDYPGLDGGNYAIHVRDNTCQKDTNVALAEPLPLAVLTENKTDITCNGLGDGTLTVTATGGITPYTYILQPGALSTNATGSFTSLAAGTYFVEIHETNNCSVVNSSNFTIMDPDPIIVDSTAKTDITCGGSATGQLTVYASGGTLPLSYTVTSGSNTFTNATGIFTTLPAGTYSISVTDANNCGPVSSAPVTINQPTPISINNLTITNLTCNGSGDGIINISAIGGTGALTYALGIAGIPQASGTFDSLSTGTQTIRIADAASCVLDTDINVNEPAAIAVTISPDNGSTCISFPLAMSAVITGGNGGNNYSWSATAGSFSDNTSATPDYSHNASGTFTITLDITDSKGCTGSDNTTVTVGNSAPSITVQPVDAQACAGTDTAFSVTASGSGLTYVWKKDNITILGANTNRLALTNISAADVASYKVEITGCSVTVISNTVNLSLSASPVITTQPVDAVVCTGGDTSFTVTAIGTSLTYQWRKGGTDILGATSQTLDITNAQASDAGSYTVVVGGCSSSVTSNPATLSLDALPSINTQPADAFACTGDDVTFTVSASGANLSYQWYKDALLLPGQTASSLTLNNVDGTDVATYNVEVSGCGNTVPSNNATLTLDAAPSVTTDPSAVAVCSGENATFSVTASGSVTSYQWRKNGVDLPGETNSSLTITGATAANAGNYDVIVYGCSGSDTSNTAALTIKTSGVTNINVATTNITTCAGDATGSLTITPVGGTAPIRYALDGGILQVPNTFNGLTAKTYSVEVTDNSGCMVSTTATINEPNPVAISSITTTKQQGATKGTALVNMASRGSEGLLYWYDNNANQADSLLTGISEGNYIAHVMDKNSCSDSMAFTITDTLGVSLTLNGIDNVSCFGLSDGNIHVSYSGGTQPYTFTIAPGADTLNIPAGTYRAKVTDSFGSTDSMDITVTEPAVVHTTYTVVNYDGTAGTGSISMSSTGGSGTYLYNFDGGGFDPTSSYASLAANSTYSVSAIDNNSCPNNNDTVITILDDSQLTIDYSVSHAVCNGGFGSITAEVLTGAGPYRYRISGAKNKNVTNVAARSYVFDSLPAGTYTLNVYDKFNNNQKIQGINITQPPTPLVLSYSTTAQTILTPANGSIKLTGSGGSGLFSYSLDGVDFSNGTGNFSGLTGDSTYTGYVKDAVGCITSKSIYVAANMPLTYTVTGTPESCKGTNDGKITFIITSGIKPFYYSIDSLKTAPMAGSDTMIFSNVPTGLHYVTVVDKNDTLFKTVTVDTATSITIDNIVTTPSSNGNTGTITVTAHGGTGNLTYAYNSENSGSFDNGTNNVFTGLPVDTFYVIVSDAGGCAATQDTAIVEQDTVLNCTVTITDVTCISGINGAINIVPLNGLDPIDYYVTDTTGSTIWQDNGIYTDMSPGLYHIFVRDAEGKKFRKDTTIKALVSEITLSIDSVIPACSASGVGSLYVTVNGGQAPYSYLWINSSTKDTISQTEDLVNEKPGLPYRLKVTDIFNCPSLIDTSIIVNNLGNPTIVTTPSTCNTGLLDGAISVTPSGNGPFHYSWSHNATLDTANVSGLAPGDYSLIISNAACSEDTVITVIASNNLIASWTPVNETCKDSAYIAVAISSGTPTFTYTITDAFNVTNTILSDSMSGSKNFAVGAYSIRLQDSKLCYIDTNFTLLPKPAIDTIIIDDITTSPATASPTGSITVTAHSKNNLATLIYSYTAVNNPPVDNGTNNVFLNVPADSFFVTVQDEAFCYSVTDTAVVLQDTVLKATVAITDAKCYFPDAEGTISITLTSPAIAPVTYNVTNGGTGDYIQIDNGFFTVYDTGSYDVSAEDNVGRRFDTTVFVHSLVSKAITLVPTVTDPACSDTANGSIDVNVSGGMAPYSYVWFKQNENTSNYDTLPTQTTNVLTEQKGKYRLVVTDSYGCEGRIDSSLVVRDLKVNIDFTNSLCNVGITNGTITIDDFGANFTYKWKHDTTINSATLDSLVPGTYEVTIVGGVNCQVDTSITISQLDSLNISWNNTDPACSDGALGYIVNSGTPDYTFTIKDLATNQTATYVNPGNFSTIADSGTYFITLTDSFFCYVEDTIDLKGFPAMKGTVSIVDTPLCHNTFDGKLMVEITRGKAPFNISWDGNAGESIDVFTNELGNIASGTHNVSITDANDCPFDSAVDLPSKDTVNFSIGTTDATCSVPGKASIKFTNGNPTFKYFWNNGDTLRTDNPSFELSPDTLGPRSYSFTVMDTLGCQESKNFTINVVKDLDLTELKADATCLIDGNIYFELRNMDTPLNFVLQGDTVDINTSIDTLPFIFDKTVAIGEYFFKVSNKLCDSTKIISIIPLDTLKVDLGPDAFVCRGQEHVMNSTIKIDTILLTSSDGVMYSWGPTDEYFVDGNVNASSPIVIGNIPDMYKVNSHDFTLMATYGKCTESDTITLSYYPSNGVSLPNFDTVSKGVHEIQPLIGGTGQYIKYSWAPNIGVLNGSDSTPVLVANFKTEITYYFIGTTESGCEEIDSIHIAIAPSVIPTDGLTPNGDGYNDFWYIPNAEFYAKNLHVIIFNRWGEKILDQEGYTNSSAQGWIGKYKGKDLPIGTYYYVITVEGAKAQTGTVTIMR